MAIEEGNIDDNYTQDGSVDLKGKPVLRSKTGGWTACSFIIMYEMFERMAFFSILFNLVIYLTRELHQGTVTSSNNVTNWTGVAWLTPILGAYVADAHLGRYKTFIISSAIYLMGMILLTLTVSLPALKPPKCEDNTNAQSCKKASTLQLAVFYGALYTIAIGTAGTKPNIATIGADQFDDFHPKEKAKKLSFFNWWMFSVFFGTLFSSTALVWIQDNIGWTLGYGLPTAGLAISIVIVVAGTRFYRHKVPPEGSDPLTRMVRVVVAALRKWKVSLPEDHKELYELHLEVYEKRGGIFRIDSTSTMRFLNKAAVRTGSTSPWMLCSVTQVEETKQMVRLFPIFLCLLVPNIVIVQTATLFIKQGTTLDRAVGNSGFTIPPGSLATFTTVSMLITVVLYDRLFVKIMRKWTNNPRGISLLQRVGTGMALHIVIMAIASFVERHRLRVAREQGLVNIGDQVPLSIFILVAQFSLMGVSDAFLLVGTLEFFYDQAPENMKSLGTSLAFATIGLGSFVSSALLSIVSNVTKNYGHRGWILDNLNISHLDYYYAFLALLSLLNLIFYLFLCKYFYEYRAEVSDSIKVLTQELKEKS